MLKLSAITLLLFGFIMNAQAYEEAQYEVLKKDGNIETRLYKKAFLAQFHSKGSRKTAGSTAFMPLFNYIKDGGIPMTTPVTLEEVSPNEWDVSFFMPSEKSIEDLPNPNNSEVKITELNERKMIVYKFTGSMNDSNFDKYNLKFMQYIDENKISIKDQAISASYNAPFIPWFLRRSEIMYELQEVYSSCK